MGFNAEGGDAWLPRRGEDGSWTLESQRFGECFHSRIGALSETEQVYLAGLVQWRARKGLVSEVHVLELGFGMGYGFCATLDFFSTLPPDASRRYTALEKYPLPESQALPFPSLWEMFESDRDCLLRQKHWVHPPLRCELRIGDVRVLLPTLGAAVDVVFWDAFSPKVAPECWERPLFEQVFALINPGGCLLTYCSAGQVRRHLQAAGFEVIKVRQPGPKKETLQAWKI